MHHRELRIEIAEAARRMSDSGLVTGTSGNVSARTGDGGFLITPSGVPYPDLTPESIVLLSREGDLLSGSLAPSVETPMHLGIYAAHPEARAIVHTHSRYAMTLACLGLEVPPVHYMLADLSDEGRVPLAPYALYGSKELAGNAARAMGERHRACLLQSHGAITVGNSVKEALDRSELLEEMAHLYYNARLAGEPILLSQKQISATARKMAAGYGRPRTVEPERAR